MAKASGDIGPDHTAQGEHKQAVKDMFVLAMVDTLSMELPGFYSRHFIEDAIIRCGSCALPTRGAWIEFYGYDDAGGHMHGYGWIHDRPEFRGLGREEDPRHVHRHDEGQGIGHRGELRRQERCQSGRG